MRVLTFVLSALVVLSAKGVAAAACCDNGNSCTHAACCIDHHDEVAMEPTVTGLTAVAPGFEWPEEARPVRQSAKVLFRDPVRIGNRVLIGAHVIEHDEERMARGLPSRRSTCRSAPAR
jgi:hypothetical protein